MADDTQRTDPNDTEALRSYHISPSWKALKPKTPAEEIEDMTKGLRALCEGTLDCGCNTVITDMRVFMRTCQRHAGSGFARARSHPEITGATPVQRSHNGNSFRHDGGGKRACEHKTKDRCPVCGSTEHDQVSSGKTTWIACPEMPRYFGVTYCFTGRDGSGEGEGNDINEHEEAKQHVRHRFDAQLQGHNIMGRPLSSSELAAAQAGTNGNSYDGGGERACEPSQNLTGENGTNVNHDTIEQRLRNRRDRLERQYDDVQARLTALDHDQEQRDREYRAAHGELTDDLRRIEAQRELVDAILAGTEGDEG